MEDTPPFARLLLEALNGRTQAKQRLFDPCTRALGEWAKLHLRGLFRTKITASDLVQETILHALENLRQFRGNTPEEFACWLMRIERTQLLQFLRGFRRASRNINRESPTEASVVKFGLVDKLLSPLDQVIHCEKQQSVRSALQNLPDKHRRVIDLRLNLGLGFDAIGRELECKPDAARMLFHRVLQSLKPVLEDMASN